MTDIKEIPLVSSEISGLWDSYVSDSLAKQVLSYFFKNVQDNETRMLLQQALDYSNQHIPIIVDIFNREELPIPQGFNENDVNLNAQHFSKDTFYLAYITFMARIGMHNYTQILNQCSRSDIRDYISKRIIECIDLYNKSVDLRLLKGIFMKAPNVEIPKRTEYIQSKKKFYNRYAGGKTSVTVEGNNTYIWTCFYKYNGESGDNRIWSSFKR